MVDKLDMTLNDLYVNVKVIFTNRFLIYDWLWSVNSNFCSSGALFSHNT